VCYVFIMFVTAVNMTMDSVLLVGVCVVCVVAMVVIVIVFVVVMV